MENKGVICDVARCIHNNGCEKCELCQIKVTEHTAPGEQAVETPHFCQNYQCRDCGCQ